MEISPKYKMKLVKQVKEVLVNEYGAYSKELEGYFTNVNKQGNFKIHYYTTSYGNLRVEITETLLGIPQDDLFRIAIDMGIDVPMVIPAFPTFTRKLYELDVSVAGDTFQSACKSVYEKPAQAIVLANSSLESVIKHVLESLRIKHNRKDTLYKLTEIVLKEFKFSPSNELQKNIRNIGSSLLNISQNIETIRSDKTFAHGKRKDDYVVDDNLYAVFIVNAAATVGLFLLSFYEKKCTPATEPVVGNDDPSFKK